MAFGTSLLPQTLRRQLGNGCFALPRQTNVTITGLAYPNEFFNAARQMTRTATVYQMRLKVGQPYKSKFVFDRWTGMSDGWEWQHFGHIGIDPMPTPTVTDFPTIRNLWAALTLMFQTITTPCSLNPNRPEFALILSFEAI